MGDVSEALENRILLSSIYTLLSPIEVFREQSSRKTTSFEEQIMSKDKYPGIVKWKLLPCLNIFRSSRDLKNGEDHDEIYQA